MNDGSALLIAPGRRYRLQDGAGVRGCDGQHPWEPREDDDEHGEVHWISGPEPPLPALLRPAWLLRDSDLEVLGRVIACGRDAWHVAVTRRPGRQFDMSWAALGADRAEVVVDAELGILLRLAWDAGEVVPGGKGAGGEPPDGEAAEVIEGLQVRELISLVLEPVIDPALFAPPPGSRVGESFGESLSGFGPAGKVLKTAGGLIAGGLGAWIRHSSSQSGAPAAGAEDAATAIPADDPAPELSPDGQPSGPAVRDEVLHLLQKSGAASFTATVHEWYDAGAMLRQVPAGARSAGFGGLGSLIDTLTARPAVLHRIASLRVGGPGQYQLDRAAEQEAAGPVEARAARKRKPVSTACDGQRCWRVYDDAVTVGPAAPLDHDIAELTDGSWLLQVRLAGGEPITVDGRRAYRVQAGRGGALATPSTALLFRAAVAVVDAELGIVLRLASYASGKPVRRYELRDIVTGAGEFRGSTSRLACRSRRKPAPGRAAPAASGRATSWRMPPVPSGGKRPGTPRTPPGTSCAVSTAADRAAGGEQTSQLSATGPLPGADSGWAR